MLKIGFLDQAPIVGKNVYGAAFPFEKPPRAMLDIFAPDATTREITEIVCEEILHIKRPELSEEAIKRLVPACVEGGSDEEHCKDILKRAGYQF